MPAPSEPADAELVAAAIRDPLAFAPLYRRYATPIFRYCYRHVSDPELAADLTTQIFTSAIEALPHFEQRVEQRIEHREPVGATSSATGSSFRGWLFTIAHNAVIDHRRRARPSRPLDDTHRDIADEEQSPEERAILRDELSRLIAVLDRIPDGQRQIIELRLAGLTAQTRAYARLRVLLGPPSALSSPLATSPQEPSHDRA